MKKLLSIILCLAMLAGMLPAVFATETLPEVGTEFTYKFGREALLNPSEFDTSNKVINALVTDTTDLNSSVTYPWIYASRFDYYSHNAWNNGYVRHSLKPLNSARFAFKLTIPYAGKYDINIAETLIYNSTGFKKNTNGNGCYINGATDVYIFPSTEGLTIGSWTPGTKEKVTTFRHFMEESVTTGFEFETAGTYYFLFNLDMDNEDFVNFCTTNNIVLDDGDDTQFSSNEIARVYCDLGSITLTYQGEIGTEEPEPEDPVLEDISSSNDYSSATHDGLDKTSIAAYAVYGSSEPVEIETGVESFTFGQSYDLTAPDAPEGYKFLYWAKGLSEKKQILTYDEELLNYRPTEGTNYLIAVYEAEGEETEETDRQEFYNANGQLLDVGITNDVMPDYPSMPGYGKAVGWALKGEGDTYTEYEAGETAPETDGKGTMIFMAIYNDLEKNITVTVNGTADKYAYGDPVTCTAEASTADGEFMYWKKDGKIASVEQAYKFLAFTDSTVEAVYGGGIETLSEAFRNIILTRFTAGDATAIMAEFIGFEDDVEKGIMFGNTKLAMTTDGNQFAVIDDWTEETTATGYAIVRDGNNLKKITDGEATIGKENEEILAERRNIAESYMRESVSLLWTPSENINYHVGPADGGFDATLVAGRIYRGLPYVYNASSPDAFLNYAGEPDANGVYTISGLNSEALSGAQGVARIGNDCSGAIERAWAAMGANIQAKATKYMVPANGFIKVGDYETTSTSDFTGGTIAIATQNGEQKMYEAYACLQKADAMVEWDSAGGHSRMVVSVSVVRNSDGTIDGDNSKIRMLEQTRTEFKNAKTYKTLYGVDYGNGIEGDVYVIGGDYSFKFSDLYAEGYLPITCRELVDANYIDEASVTDSVDTPTIDNLFTGTISSNWAIDTVTLNITGDGVSQSATASIARADIFKFSMAQFEEDKSAGKLYGSYDIDGLTSGTYKCTVTVTLVDGTKFTVRDFDFTK